MHTTDFIERTPLGWTRDGYPLYSIKGSEQGYNTQGDIVRETADGQPLAAIWAEFQQTLSVLNAHRDAVTSLLSFSTTDSAAAVAQTIGEDDFELASEFGEPVGLRSSAETLLMGFPFRDWDKATRFTWRFLRDATREQVEAVHAQALYADNKLVTTAIMKRLLDPTAGTNEHGNAVYGLWNGDSLTPPRHLFNTFDTDPHTHYLVSGADTVDGKDIDDLYAHVAEHGYLDVAGTRAILFANPVDVAVISRIRVTDAAQPSYDFIPSEGAAPYLADQDIIGQIAPATYNGLEIAGSYGNTWIAPTAFMPPGYLALVATGGPGSPRNPIGFREHINPGARGLRLIPGYAANYPLIDSFYTRGFGVGVRHRGAAAVMQIKASGAYEVPEL